MQVDAYHGFSQYLLHMPGQLLNKAVKNFLRQQFQMWYADKVCEQLAKSRDNAVDLKLSIVKPLGASWMIKAHDYIILQVSQILLSMVLKAVDYLIVSQ